MSDLILPGTAGPSDVLSGQTFSAGNNFEATGTMPNNGATVLTASGNGSVAIPAGYHNGAGYVAQVSVPAANVLTGTTIASVAGTMPNRGAPTWTPGATAQNLSAGYYSGGTINGDGNLVAANIKSGVTIFGVLGTAPIPSHASGSATVNSSNQAVVSGLAFQPKIVVIEWMSANSSYYYRHVLYPATRMADTNTGAYTVSGGGAYMYYQDTWSINASGFVIGDNYQFWQTGAPSAQLISGVTFYWEAWG